jgi:hypothetical protein
MTIYNLYIYNRKGECIFYKEWNRSKQSGLPEDQVSYFLNLIGCFKDPFSFCLKEFRQMFGCIVELKSFVNKMSPTDLL